MVDDQAFSVGRNADALARANEITATLATAARFEQEAERFRASGYTDAATRSDHASAGALQFISEPPSVARIRAAYILLDGVTDETLSAFVAPYAAKLAEIIRRVDAFEL